MKPSFDDEDFGNRVERILCMLDHVHESKSIDIHDTWCDDMENKWFKEESEDCLIGKCESWQDVRNKLSEHYGWEDGWTSADEE